jgi:hypothetical protein
MNLKYRISETTQLEPYVVKAHILLKLKDENYRVQDVTNNIVTFDESPFKMMWRHEAIKRLDAGRFEIEASTNGTTVTFIHFLRTWPVLVALAPIIIGCISFNDYFPIPFFCLFLMIGMTWQYYTLKVVGREMLRDIVASK